MTAGAKPERKPGSRIRTAFIAVVTLVYPGLVYLGLLRHSARTVGLLVVGVIAVLIAARAWSADKKALWSAVRPLLPALVLGTASAAIDDPRFLFAVPVLISLSLLLAFAATLRAGATPMIERFARTMEPELPPGGEAHCRAVTWAWVVFFGVNASVAGGLAILGPVSWWAAYTGLVSYVLIGLMFTVEVIVRKIRFRRYGDGLLDRVFAAIFPPPQA